ncbi:MAG: ABC transporter permease [Planctomycetota bacterium]|nr:ABC transporter permease [Planctomycetota bacterium]MDA0969573.1 ABC transporter permease [Planctomycetota bacterium]
MNFLQQLRLGFRSLLLHKLRSALAVLGILIGVTAVIWLVALGEGVSYQAQQQIKNLGATSIIVRSIKPTEESDSESGSRSGIAYGLLRDDYDRILANVPTITKAMPMREINREVRNGEFAIDATLVGCTPEYFDINRLGIERGRPLSAADMEYLDNVAVLAYEVAERLFPIEDPVGRAVQIGDEFYVVIGVAEQRTASAAIGGSLAARQYDKDVYIPLSTFRARIGDRVITVRGGTFQNETVELNQITAVVDDMKAVDSSADIIRDLLRRYHKSLDYAVVVPKELLEQAETLRTMFNVLLLLIAGISLLVGGIGIMNIMLATVTERTREIGIRRALGATKGEIVQQFLWETVVLSGTGGLLGVAFGFLCGPTVALVRQTISELFPEVWSSLPPNIRDLEPLLAPWSIAAAFGISVGVGIIFGIYPARRAANMDPIEALRHE